MGSANLKKFALARSKFDLTSPPLKS